MEEYVVIGKLNKTFGDEGSLRYTIFDPYKDDFQNCKFIFILLDGIYVPFPLHPSFNINQKEIRLQFVDSTEHAEEISGKEIYLKKESIVSANEEVNDGMYSFLKGFKAFHNQDQLLGLIADVVAYPMQEMAIIGDSNQILIPLHESLIERIDRNNHTVHFILPEGLV